MSEAPKVAIIGTGLIGRGWAVAFARAGWRVALWDQAAGAAEAARLAARDALIDMERADLVDAASEKAAGISLANDLKAALTGADYVQESVPERAEIKRDGCGANVGSRAN
jgi:L-gulonate 3-dehydrogenase